MNVIPATGRAEREQLVPGEAVRLEITVAPQHRFELGPLANPVADGAQGEPVCNEPHGESLQERAEQQQ